MKNDSTNYDLNWFEKGDWKEGWQVKPDESINKTEFIKHYALHPERWQKAFKFMAETDLKNLAVGKHEIDGTNLFVNINEYASKDEAPCEGHLKYIDIQFVISGEEKIGITPMAKTKEATPYDDEKDVYFMQPLDEKFYPANQGNFFIFFPSDAHRPAIKIADSVPVKKAIVKLKI